MTKKTEKTKDAEIIEENAVAVSETGKEVAVHSDTFFDLDEEAAEVESSIERVKIVSGAGCQFEVGDGDYLREFTCVIIHKHKANVYWGKPFSERDENDKPECASSDAIKPNPNIVNPKSAECATCPLNQWGSSENGEGKACDNRLNIYFMRSFVSTEELAKYEGDFFDMFKRDPEFISIPPASLGKKGTVHKCFFELRDKKLSFRQVPFVFYLKPAKNQKGIAYSEFNMKYVLPAITPEDTPDMWEALARIDRTWKQQIKDMIYHFANDVIETE